MLRFHHFLHYQADATHTSLFACIISVEVIHEMWGRHVKQRCHTVIWQRGQAGETVGVTAPIIIQLHSVPPPRIWNAIMRNQEPENKRILTQILAVGWLYATNSSLDRPIPRHSLTDLRSFPYRLFVVRPSTAKSNPKCRLNETIRHESKNETLSPVDIAVQIHLPNPKLYLIPTFALCLLLLTRLGPD
ncbi:hypothetical protein L207DRAFT_211439 [Hyaloscypha variabilis F]|uniref:Uncharacterized protein n=1 Tax=Hyaloscypha variabilis (strain UAMH 11265 / GT02V1 / F) TaxID=1149755 RepID=A0A2J6S6H3_HYAVF|nr:hypothetical protein L207DRAFT_211439 [Hyaloscypha variabilis F]